ncbi:integrase, catalytic region, zinc finger, CCHC-type containing protein [Tanacetum coccineum]
MKESEAYKSYHDIATGKVQPKPKYVRRYSRTKTDETPKPSSDKRVKTTAKVAKSGKKKQPAPGLEALSDIALTKAEQMKLAIERSKTQLHSSQPSGSGAHEGTGVSPGVPDAPTCQSDDEEVSWKSSDEDDDDEVNVSEHGDDDDDEQTESDNDGENFVHPKFSTHDDEAKQDEEVNEEDSFDPRVQTPFYVESTDDEDSDDEIHDANVERDKMNEEETYTKDEANVLYGDMNINLEGRGQQQSSSVSSGFVSNMLNPRPDTSIDSVFALNTEATSLVDVLVTTIAEPPLLSATTLSPPPNPLITHLQQTPVPTPTTIPSSSLQDLPNFRSLFGFDHRLKTLETDFSEFKQINQFNEAVSSIPDIVDAYLANKMNEAVKTTVQLQSNKLRYEALAENEAFLNLLDENIKKIIKDQVKQQTSHIVVANLSELELKKILIDKMESNKLIHKSDEPKNLYKALFKAYESDKLILDTYGDIVSFKRPRDDEDKDEEPSTRSNWGSKRRRARKEPELTSALKEKTSKTTGKSTDRSKSQHKSAGESAHTVEPMHTDKDLEEPAHQEFDIGATKEQSDEETSQYLDCNSAREEGPRKSFDELMDTPLDLLAFMMNRLKIDTLTPELLAGQTFELMKGTCKSLVKLEYLFEEVYKATTDQLDWHNPEDLVPNTICSEVRVNYDKHALWGISYWGRKCQQFYGYAANRESARDVYSKRRIIAVIKLQIVKWHSYKHLDWITVRRDDDKLYTFKEGDFKRLRLQDIEDMLILLVQGKLTNLNVKDHLAFGVSLRMFTRSIIIQRRVEDLHLGVESYQKKLNITKPDTYRSNLKRRDAYTTYSNPRGFIYQNKDKKNKLMHIDELHKFSDGTLDDVRTALNDRLKVRLRYSNPMIQTEPKGFTQGYPLVSVEVLRFDTSAGNLVKEILLKLNLPDHRSILTDSKILKDGGKGLFYDEPLRIKLLQLATLLLKYLQTDLVHHRKELIKFGWNHLKREDSASKQWAFVNACHFLKAYQTPKKIILQVICVKTRTDNANIARKRSKPDKHGHGNR